MQAKRNRLYRNLHFLLSRHLEMSAYRLLAQRDETALCTLMSFVYEADGDCRFDYSSNTLP